MPDNKNNKGYDLDYFKDDYGDNFNSRDKNSEDYYDDIAPRSGRQRRSLPPDDVRRKRAKRMKMNMRHE